MSRDVNAPDYVLARTTLPQALDRASILQTEMNDAAEALRTMRDLVLAERLDQVRPELRAKTTAVVRALQRVRAEEYQALTVYVAAAERALGGRHPLLTDALWPALINPDGTRSWLDEQIEYKQARGLLDP
jgi:hypothetical protein